MGCAAWGSDRWVSAERNKGAFLQDVVLRPQGAHGQGGSLPIRCSPSSPAGGPRRAPDRSLWGEARTRMPGASAPCRGHGGSGHELGSWGRLRALAHGPRGCARASPTGRGRVSEPNKGEVEWGWGGLPCLPDQGFSAGQLCAPTWAMFRVPSDCHSGGGGVANGPQRVRTSAMHLVAPQPRSRRVCSARLGSGGREQGDCPCVVADFWSQGLCVPFATSTPSQHWDLRPYWV